MAGRTAGLAVVCSVALLAACSIKQVSYTPSDDAGGPTDAGVANPGPDAATTATVTIRRTGAATGAVTAEGAQLTCSDACTATVPIGTTITLSATPDVGARFGGWTGDCTSTDPTCTLTVARDVAIGAAFDVATFTVTVGLTGSGSGVVSSSPVGVLCPGACTLVVPYNTTVSFAAAAAANSTFLGWTGACTGDTCALTVTSDVAVTAGFAADNELDVVRAGNGTGTVTSVPAGISCGADCSEAFPPGTVVTLTATPGPSAVFTGWSGGCTGAGTCTVTMNSAQSVTATFVAITGDLVTTDFGGTPKIMVFAAGANGNATPLRTITGPDTTFSTPRGITVFNNEILVVDQQGNAIDVFPIVADGDAAPTRRIAGPATQLSNPLGLGVAGNEIYVAQNLGQILVFPLTANGNVAPTRTITIGSNNHDHVAFAGGEIYTTDLSGNIEVFPMSASGTVTATRTITTDSFQEPSGIAISNGEIFVSDFFSNSIYVFPQGANGNVTPSRLISGSNTQLSTPDQLVVFGGEIYSMNISSARVVVFPASANGNIVPTRQITGFVRPFGVFGF